MISAFACLSLLLPLRFHPGFPDIVSMLLFSLCLVVRLAASAACFALPSPSAALPAIPDGILCAFLPTFSCFSVFFLGHASMVAFLAALVHATTHISNISCVFCVNGLHANCYLRVRPLRKHIHSACVYSLSRQR